MSQASTEVTGEIKPVSSGSPEFMDLTSTISPQRVGALPPKPSPMQRVAGTLAQFPSKVALGCIFLGALAIVIGVAGARSATVGNPPVVLVQAQLPYLMSGGIGGLALIIVGAALLIVQNHRVDSERLRTSIERLVSVQEAALPAQTPAPDDLAGLVVAGGSSYHLPSCRLVEGRSGMRYLLPAEARAAGLAPCRVCNSGALTG